MGSESTDLAIKSDAQLATAQDFMPAMNIEQAIARYNIVVDFCKKVMKPGRDYGIIPGTERKSKDGVLDNSANTLLKPGAEKLCTLFGLSPRFEDYRITEDWDKGLFYYAFRCILSRNGRVIAEAIGSANSREKKYRRESRCCPGCGKNAIGKSKYPPRGSMPGTPPGWYCNPKNGGCGDEFVHDDPEVVNQNVVTDVNAAADLVNTLQKMAQKRALVGVTLIATNASEFFTQDVEDMMPVAGDEVIDAEVVDGGVSEVRPVIDLANDETFIAEWRKCAIARGCTDEAMADKLLSGFLKVNDMTLDAVTLGSRKSLLNRFIDGKFDSSIEKAKAAISAPSLAIPQAVNSAPTSQPESPKPLTPEQLTELLASDWPTAKKTLCAFARQANISRADFESGVVKHFGVTPEKSTAIQRAELADAIMQGRWDPKTGAVRPVAVSGASS